ncbi:MAG: hypothetical protein B7Z20_07725 [Sphingobium sp. 32-64-5]|nr:MAG: hypothetical protein B7Z20_07725 [Sphingobium sp. 32-64-5]
MRARPPFPLVWRDTSGATIIEFAFVAPLFSLLLVGAFDVGHTLYTQAILQGAVQKAARDSALESNISTEHQDALDQKVRDMVLNLNKNATVDITRRYYKTFEEAERAQEEPYTDTNGDGTCNADEPYTDTNGNDVWDADGGNSGQGGAKDLVVFSTVVSYPRILPLHSLVAAMSFDQIDLPDTVTLRATTVLANQPYSEQSSYAEPVVKNCP